jgi:WD40 repeat protein
VGHRRAVTCVALHPAVAVAASGSEDGSVRTWDLEAGTLERTLLGAWAKNGRRERLRRSQLS